MLFDFRGRGRRRTVQVIYLSLAILMGGGLVLFGIGGDVQGGLLDAFREDTGSQNEVIDKQVDDAEKRVKANRSDAAAWAALAQARFAQAGSTEGFNDETQEFTGESRERVVDATRAWEQHLKLAGDKPDADTAAILTRAFLALNQPEKAVRTQEIVIDSTPNPGPGQYSTLAQYAYLAGQVRKGDLATQKALEDAKEEDFSKERQEELKTELEDFKNRAAQAAAEDAQGGGGAAPPVSPAPAPASP
jgi:hypothetical protein